MKIAAFDSGVGGLTAIVPILKKFPQASVTYLGDLVNLPYGAKSPARIQELTRKNLEWLLSAGENFDLIIVACNTASAHAIAIAEEAGKKAGIPVVGVIKPGCQAALEIHAPRTIILATSATVASETYVKELKALGYKGLIVQKACPLFVPLVEDQLYAGPAVELIARRYLDDVIQKGDAVILGCTHYPFLVESLKALYPSVEWIDAGAALLKDKTFQLAVDAKKTSSVPPGLDLVFTDPASEEKIRGLLARLQSQATLKSVKFAHIE